MVHKTAYLRLNISNLCNFSCKYCHVFKITNNNLPPKVMEYDIMDSSIQNFIRILKKYGDDSLTISIYGGEPLINKKNLFKIIEKYNNQYNGVNINWMVNTNGSLLSEDVADFFKKYDVEVHLSVDGFERTHNKNRIDKFDNGTFEKVEKALCLIKQKGVRSQINSFVFPENVDHLFEIVDLAKKFDITKIYLDLFYDTKKREILPETLSKNYFEAYNYGQRNNVSVTGPWATVFRAYQERNTVKSKVPATNVTVDGKFFFNYSPTMKPLDLEHLNYNDFKAHYLRISRKFKNLIDDNCKHCFLKKSCYGTAITQFQYHTKLDKDWGYTCESFKEIIKLIKDQTDNKNKTNTDTTQTPNTHPFMNKIWPSNNTTGPVKLVQVNVTYRCNKDCGYCYAKPLGEDFDKDMSLEDFRVLLGWFERNGVRSFNVLGGEPTVHPAIGEMLTLAKEKKFNITIFTNGLFSEAFLKYLDCVDAFLINYNPESMYTREEYGLLHRNLDYLKSRGKVVRLAFNITSRTVSCDYVIKAAKKYNAKSVNIDLIIPNSLKSNEYLPSSSFQDYKGLLSRFLKKFRENNIRVKITRPFPFCIFKDLMEEHKEALSSACSIGYGVVSINPDLSVFPCLSVFFKGPKITSFNDLQGVFDFYRGAIDDVKWKRHLYPKCGSCIYLVRKKCQGSCLCYKCTPFNTINKQNYVLSSQYNTSEIKDFIKNVDQVIESLNTILGKPKRKIKIYLFNNKKDMLYYSGVYFYPDWVRGFTSKYNYYQCIIKSNKRIYHELCHIYINQIRKGEIPLWLEEGFCEYLTYNDKDDARLINILKTKKLIPFDKLFEKNKFGLLKYDNDPLDENVAYIQSRSLVSFLADKFGINTVIKFLKEDYKDFKQHFKELTGCEFRDEEKAWLKKISKAT